MPEQMVPESGLVSVIIPTYNRYHYLRRAVQSVLTQTYPFIEVIVIDDCSTAPEYANLEDDLDKLRSDTNENVQLKIMKLPVNMRVKHNSKSCQGLTRNEGIAQARGEWIAFLDDDDMWIDENKLARQIQEMRKQNIFFSTTNMWNTDGTHLRYCIPPIITKEHMQHGNHVCTSTVVIHKLLLDMAGLFKDVPCEDYDCWKRVMEHSQCLYINYPSTYYELHTPKHYTIDN